MHGRGAGGRGASSANLVTSPQNIRKPYYFGHLTHNWLTIFLIERGVCSVSGSDSRANRPMRDANVKFPRSFVTPVEEDGAAPLPRGGALPPGPSPATSRKEQARHGIGTEGMPGP